MNFFALLHSATICTMYCIIASGQIVPSTGQMLDQSMIFLENATNASVAVKTPAEVSLAKNYGLAIVGWGANTQNSPVCREEEKKLATEAAAIKAAGSGTRTAVYAGRCRWPV